MPRSSKTRRETANCFVIMSFKPELDVIYKKIYKPACEEFDVECERIDENHEPGLITTSIIHKILDADFIIADLTFLNANVFYELGFAHTARKPVILTTQGSRNDLPFDIRPLNVIRYEPSIEGKDILLGQLELVIENVLDKLPQTFDNPIADAMRRRRLVLQDENVVMLDERRIMQLITLHSRSTKYLASVIFNKVLLEQEAGVFTGNTPEFVAKVYGKIVESAEDCAGFSGKCIDDVYEFLTAQFTLERLSEIIANLEKDLLSKPLSIDAKRRLGEQDILLHSDSIFRRIEMEIKRLYNLPECE